MPDIPTTSERDFTSSVPMSVIHEQLVVGKERVETGRVRIAKQVREEIQTVDLPVIHEEVDVERVPMHRPVDTMPSVRHEGDTLVIPVVREELVVEKRLVLTEEIRITRKTSHVNQTQDVTLRREELIIDRQASGPEVQG